ncbi:hypothetical protein SRO_3004 [Streptomyces rochei]|nr:hypothetical protein SRO_3004 [Streptomyces rochei]
MGAGDVSEPKPRGAVAREPAGRPRDPATLWGNDALTGGRGNPVKDAPLGPGRSWRPDASHGADRPVGTAILRGGERPCAGRQRLQAAALPLAGRQSHGRAAPLRVRLLAACRATDRASSRGR